MRSFWRRVWAIDGTPTLTLDSDQNIHNSCTSLSQDKF